MQAFVQTINAATPSAVATCPVGVVALDLIGVVRLWNRAATRLLGWSEHEVIGRPCPTAGALAHSVDRGTCLLAGKDGAPVRVVVWATPWYSDARAVIGTLLVITPPPPRT